MDTVTYPDPRVAEFASSHFVTVRVTVKTSRALVEEYLVSWTPNVVIADDRGRVHYRIEGFLSPDDFIAHLSLGLGRFLLDRRQFDEAAERFEEVARRHHNTDAGAEAQYWIGVARYKASHDPARLHSSWDGLVRDHPHSEWARKAQIPSKT
ncbi:MAG TPA: hypothetical protein VKD90_10920 [Gemmataceae bacterium]|nr:hypothetical protein [Gemmataceae bacterium]